MTEVSPEVKEYLGDLLQLFSPGLRYVCAYGSGVFKQDGHKSINGNMIDLIFVVHDSFTWHQQNLKRYPNHYSFLKHLQPHQIANIQKHYGTAIYYNTRIEFGGRRIKYGVIELSDFLNGHIFMLLADCKNQFTILKVLTIQLFPLLLNTT